MSTNAFQMDRHISEEPMILEPVIFFQILIVLVTWLLN